MNHLERYQPRPRGGRVADWAMVAGVCALAMAIRLILLREDSTIQRTDEAMFILSALKLHGLFTPLETFPVLEKSFWVFSFPWGYPMLLFTFSVFKAYAWLGIPIHEFTIVAPFGVLGGLSSGLVFLLARQFFPKGVALAAAVALALTPSHIAQSRTIAHWIFASDLMMITLLFYLRYLQRVRRGDAILFSFLLAIYLPSEHPSPGILPVIMAYPFLFYGWSLGRGLRGTLEILLKKEILLLPLLTLAPLLAVQTAFILKGHPTYGFLGHFLAGKTALGFYGIDLVRYSWVNGGPAVSLLMAMGFLKGCMSLAMNRKQSLFFLWFLGFGIPTVFLIDPETTVIQGYLTPLMIPLIILGCSALYEGISFLGGRASSRRADAIASVVFLVLFLWTSAMIPSRIYEKDFLFRRAPIGLWGGEIYSNNGAKTAGYWIRKHTDPGTVVMSDLRLFTGRYYFHRPTIGPEDPRIDQERPPNGRVRPGVLALTREFVKNPGNSRYLEGYGPAAIVTHRGEEVFYIFTLGREKTVIMPAEVFDPAFDLEFGRIESLHYPHVWKDDVSSLNKMNNVRK